MRLTEHVRISRNITLPTTFTGTLQFSLKNTGQERDWTVTAVVNGDTLIEVHDEDLARGGPAITYSADLTPYAGSTVLVEFNTRTRSGNTRVALDDIEVRSAGGVTPPPIDNPPTIDLAPSFAASDSDGNGSEAVTITAAVSDDDAIGSYNWMIDGISVGTEAALTYNFPVGATTVTLIVTDSAGQTAEAQTAVTVEAADFPPVVDAGVDLNGELASGTLIMPLSGDVSDDNGASITWTASGPASVSFGNAAAANTTATFTAAGTYTLTLTADDGVNAPVSDTLIMLLWHLNQLIQVQARSSLVKTSPLARITVEKVGLMQNGHAAEQNLSARPCD